MLSLLKNIIRYRKFVKLANSVGFNTHNPHPIESIAFMTVSAIKLNPKKDYILKCNDIALYDSIIFTMFVIRMICISQINNRANAEKFSNDYISKVFEYFPESKIISNKYDSDFFSERVKYYDSLLADESIPFDERIKNVVKKFGSIISYDYTGKYVRFNNNTPLMLIDFDKQFIITNTVNSYYNTLPDFFARLLPDVFKLYN